MAGDSLHEGWLVKRGQKRKTWHRRWFVLTPDELLYYERDGGTDATPSVLSLMTLKGKVDLRSPFVVSDDDDPRTLEFCVYTRERCLLVRADGVDDRQAWMGALSGSECGGLLNPGLIRRGHVVVDKCRKKNWVTLTETAVRVYDDKPPLGTYAVPRLTFNVKDGLKLRRERAKGDAASSRRVALSTVTCSKPKQLGAVFSFDDKEDLEEWVSDLVSAGCRNDPILAEGVLDKKGRKVKNWKTRWFVLTKDALRYWEGRPAFGAPDDTAKGEVLLTPCSRIGSAESGSMHHFVLETGERSLYTRTKRKKDRDGWIGVIAKAIAEYVDPREECRERKQSVICESFATVDLPEELADAVAPPPPLPSISGVAWIPEDVVVEDGGPEVKESAGPDGSAPPQDIHWVGTITRKDGTSDQLELMFDQGISVLAAIPCNVVVGQPSGASVSGTACVEEGEDERRVVVVDTGKWMYKGVVGQGVITGEYYKVKTSQEPKGTFEVKLDSTK